MLNTKRLDAYIARAAEAMSLGFASKAAQKRALDDLNRAYSMVHDAHFDDVLDAAKGLDDDARRAFIDARETPFDLHQVRARHIELMSDYPVVSQLVEMRAAAKAAEIAVIVKDVREVELRARVEKTLGEMIALRQDKFLHGVKLTEIFGGLPVTANTHWVHGEKGGQWLRTYFYMAGVLTPLQVIIAVLEDAARKKKA